jgi:tetratricopeptide (TPR) repeat protein
MRTISKYIAIVSVFCLLGCEEDFLSEEPRKQASIETAEHLEALINNAPLFVFDGSSTVGSHDATSVFSTDDVEISLDLYENNPNNFRIDDLLHYTYKIDEIRTLPSDAYYSGEYRKIFHANLVLEQLERVSGDQELKDDLRANAHFIRAYSYWILVNHYALPYANGINEEELGLTLKTTTLYEEPLARATLKETYDFILADLQEAMKTTRVEVDPDMPWLVSKKAVAAMLSRYYLFIGNYDEALTMANSALESNVVQLVDFKTLSPGRTRVFSNPSVTLRYSEMNDYGQRNIIYWKEFYMPRATRNLMQQWYPSSDLISLYDQSNDLRYKWLMIPNGAREVGIIDPPTYNYVYFFSRRHIPTGPSIAEMLLNKAEVLARKGDIGGAMDAINILREKRLENAVPIIAGNQDEAIMQVLEERRREMPYTMRWYDIRRFSINDYSGDDVTVSRTFFQVNAGNVNTNVTEEYTLAPGSRRYAVPLNFIEISSSGGQIQPNEY